MDNDYDDNKDDDDNKEDDDSKEDDDKNEDDDSVCTPEMTRPTIVLACVPDS